MLKQLVEFLRSRRQDIVQDVEVLQENWSPTYGPMEPRTSTMSVVDFDALLRAIDDFAQEFKDDQPGS